jgi:hypothetical protein
VTQLTSTRIHIEVAFVDAGYQGFPYIAATRASLNFIETVVQLSHADRIDQDKIHAALFVVQRRLA